ncbi:MAG: lytic transglycosylase domain-containing protein [Nitrospirae bacterium]|nr:lytic transglycosylase domain-containing protein [Nitrospirota bacterium]
MNCLIVALLVMLPTVCSAFCFEDAAKTNNLSPELLKGIAQVESGMNQKAVNINRNGSQDLGLMQINTFWIKPLSLDRQRLITDACYNTMTGASILKKCINRHGYTWKAVGCYNAVSEPKQQAYSWKIYKALMNERKKTENKETENVDRTAKKKSGTLTFSSRDRVAEELLLHDNSDAMEHK